MKQEILNRFLTDDRCPPMRHDGAILYTDRRAIVSGYGHDDTRAVSVSGTPIDESKLRDVLQMPDSAADWRDFSNIKIPETPIKTCKCVGTVKCDRCGGEGTINRSLYHLQVHVCPDCDGSGEVVCDICNGSGVYRSRIGTTIGGIKVAAIYLNDLRELGMTTFCVSDDPKSVCLKNDDETIIARVAALV